MAICTTNRLAQVFSLIILGEHEIPTILVGRWGACLSATRHRWTRWCDWNNQPSPRHHAEGHPSRPTPAHPPRATPASTPHTATTCMRWTVTTSILDNNPMAVTTFGVMHSAADAICGIESVPLERLNMRRDVERFLLNPKAQAAYAGYPS